MYLWLINRLSARCLINRHLLNYRLIDLMLWQRCSDKCWSTFNIKWLRKNTPRQTFIIIFLFGPFSWILNDTVFHIKRLAYFFVYPNLAAASFFFCRTIAYVIQSSTPIQSNIAPSMKTKSFSRLNGPEVTYCTMFFFPLRLAWGRYQFFLER